MTDQIAAAAAATTTTTVISAGCDTINDLPDEILTHILSFLSTKSAIQTSLISHKWRNLWYQVSSLHFPYSLTTTPRSITDFINQTLLHRPITSPSLQSFHLQFHFKETLYSSHVDSWVHYAIHHHVKELVLDFFISREFHTVEDDFDCYNFPFFCLKHGRVQFLKLIRCDVTFPSSISSLKLDSLKSVFLDQVYLRDEMVLNLVSGCLNLVCLSLENCYGMKDVKICSLKLKKLCLNYFDCDDGSLEISCPNLEFLEMVGFIVEKYDFNNLGCLIEATVAFLQMLKYYWPWSQVVRSLVHVKKLGTQNWWFKLFASKDVFSGSSIFQNLEHLELRTQYSKSDLFGIAALLEHSPNLETLILDYINKIEDDSLPEDLLNKPINKLTIPSLRKVEMRDYRETENVMILMSLLLKHGVVLEKIVLFPPSAFLGNNSESVIILQRPLEGLQRPAISRGQNSTDFGKLTIHIRM